LMYIDALSHLPDVLSSHTRKRSFVLCTPNFE
jgi:hypothetical protein